MSYEFDGVVYDKLREMQEARRARYLELVSGGMNFTRAAEAVGVSKRTGKVWRNGRGRSSGRDERALVDWYRGDMEEPKKIDGYYLSQDERIAIADGLRAGDSIRSIAARSGRTQGRRAATAPTARSSSRPAASNGRRRARSTTRGCGARSRRSSTGIGRPSRFPAGFAASSPIMMP